MLNYEQALFVSKRDASVKRLGFSMLSFGYFFILLNLAVKTIVLKNLQSN